MMALPLRQTLSRAWSSRCPPCWMVWSEPETNGYNTRAPPLLKWAFWDEKYVIIKTWRYESSRIVLRRTWFEKDKTSVQCVVCTAKVKRQRNLNFDLVGDVAWLFQLLLQIFIFPLVVSWVGDGLVERVWACVRGTDSFQDYLSVTISHWCTWPAICGFDILGSSHWVSLCMCLSIISTLKKACSMERCWQKTVSGEAHLVLWSMKKIIPFVWTRSSQPSGRGPRSSWCRLRCVHRKYLNLVCSHHMKWMWTNDIYQYLSLFSETCWEHCSD